MPGEEIDGVDLVLADADLHGCVLHFLSEPTGLDEWQHGILRQVAGDLDRIQPSFPGQCLAYFRQAAGLAHALLDGWSAPRGRARAGS